MPFKPRPGRGPTNGGGGSLMGMIAAMTGAGKPKEADKITNEKGELITPASGPYKEPGFWGKLAGNPAGEYNEAWRQQEHALANNTALAQLHHQLAMQEIDKQIAARVAEEQTRANNQLQLEEVRANVAGAQRANDLNMTAQAEENKRRLGLQHMATARAALTGDIGGAGQVPYDPDYFDFGRAQEDLLNSEAGQQLREQEAKENADLVQKQTAARYMERGMRAPMPVGQNLIWDPVSGTTSEFDPGQTITMPPGIDPNNPLKKLPGWTKKMPSHLRPIDLGGKGSQTAGQQFIFGAPDETSANTGEVTTQDEAPPAAAHTQVKPSSPSVPNTISQVTQPPAAIDLMGPRSHVVWDLKMPGLGSNIGNNAFWFGPEAGQKAAQAEGNEEAVNKFKLMRSLYDPAYKRILEKQQAYYEY